MGPIVSGVNIGWDLAATGTRWRAEPTLCLTFDVRLVAVVTDAGLRGCGAAKTQVSIASNHHALVTPITAELQPLLPPGSYQAGHGRPARIPPWLLSSLLNCRNAREILHWREIRPADLAIGEIARPRVWRSYPIVCVDVGVRVPIQELSDRIGKGGNRR